MTEWVVTALSWTRAQGADSARVDERTVWAHTAEAAVRAVVRVSAREAREAAIIAVESA